MMNKLFSGTARPGAFFRRVDWTAFWTATALSFLVYFLTLGPSVTLEDSGELAVAGDHLGVPHPPGYPIWTMCAYVFARIFDWVTFRGQPTPAWSISLMSGVFAAFAAGFTAMLITRSASDMMRDAHDGESDFDQSQSDLLCWAGGVAGSLAFAFSPVMWSQATIVEVYTLNAFFLMWIFLLTYRWMRQPTDKILWLTAFVFGLGLTNYQVLLLAALPLVVVIFLRDVALFRDFLLLGIPVALTAHVLQLGSLVPAAKGMKGPAYAKFAPKGLAGVSEIAVPSMGLLVTGCVCVALGVVAALFLRACREGGERRAWMRPLAKLGALGPALAATAGVLGALLILLAAAVTGTRGVEPTDAPLMRPGVYVSVAALVSLVIALCAAGACASRQKWNDAGAVPWLAAAGAALLILVFRLAAIPGEKIPPDYYGLAFDWALPTLALAVGLIVLFLLACTVPRGVFYALPVAAVQLSAFVLLRKGGLNGLTHPSSWWFWWPVIWNFLVVGLAWLTLPNGKTVALTTLFAELGVSFYIYMPIVSDLRNPPMNWGYPRTWEGFKHAITRGQYEKLAPSDVFTKKFLLQLGFYFTDLRMQFTLLVVPLGFLPFTLWSFRTRNGRFRAALVATALYLATFGCVLLSEFLGFDPALRLKASWACLLLAVTAVGAVALAVFTLLNRKWDLAARVTGVTLLGAVGLACIGLIVKLGLLMKHGGLKPVEVVLRFDKVLIGLILLLLLAGVALIVLRQLEEYVVRTWRAHHVSEGLTTLVVLLGLLAVVGGVLAKTLIHFLSKPPPPGALPPDPTLGLKLGALALSVLILAAVGAAWYLFRKFTERSLDVRSDMDTVTQQWLIATATGFLVMSVLLVVLANIKGDLQDAFIQKVKFVSSHGLFAIWIGYGLAFGLTLGNRLLKWLGRSLGLPGKAQKVLRVGLVGLGLLAAAIPVYENYTNESLVFMMSGAEQNGHDFGWQFGNYQLRGADSIIEELEADEEPLPNPLYPPEMEPNAIFFGGTDPGRFVPTYMIYSAQVRPDVYLITQNALADNTYMSTMRDLYGDRIWIPTPDDSARAFQVYVDEVQAGKRPKNADLTIENGRVQVSGALGVMEINGILCDMIFAKNKARHAFYIEESYVINWMFPYLTPHGLIMRINAEKQPLARGVVQDDLDFWDWYIRRLLRDPMFRRDLPAQKSFSKLRSAIAGLYVSQGLRGEAERAFQEARDLYPVSPEANFRLVQEVLLPQSRTAEAIDILDAYNQADPNNERGYGFVSYIRRVASTEARVRELSARLQANKNLTPDEAFELASSLRELGQNEAAANYLEQLAKLSTQPLERLFEIGILLGGYKRFPAAVQALDVVQSRLPANIPPERLLEMVRVYGEAGQTGKIAPLLYRYLQLRPKDWEAWIDYATLCAMQQQAQQMQYSLQQAITHGRLEALQRIHEHPILSKAAEPLMRQLIQQATGGISPLSPMRGR